MKSIIKDSCHIYRNLPASLSWAGRIKITTYYKNGKVEVDEFENIITDAGLNLLRDLLIGEVSDGRIKQIALGGSNTAPAAGDTALGDEQFRKQVTIQQADGTGRAETIAYINPNEANFQIEEIGWFAGADAAASAGSGVMVARVLYSKNKTQLESVQIDRVDVFERGV